MAGRTALMAHRLESKRKSLSGLRGPSPHFPAPFNSHVFTRLCRDASIMGKTESVPNRSTWSNSCQLNDNRLSLRNRVMPQMPGKLRSAAFDDSMIRKKLIVAPPGSSLRFGYLASMSVP